MNEPQHDKKTTAKQKGWHSRTEHYTEMKTAVNHQKMVWRTKKDNSKQNMSKKWQAHNPYSFIAGMHVYERGSRELR